MTATMPSTATMTATAGATVTAGTMASVTDLDVPSVDFVTDVPGFPGLRHFVLVQLDDGGFVFDLRSLDDASISFVVVPSVAFFPDYAPVIDDGTALALGLSDAGDAAVLVIVTVGASLAASTANLLAPIVVNTRTRHAAQVVLEGSDQPLRAALLTGS